MTNAPEERVILTIRSEQMRAFDAATEPAFIDRLVDHLETFHDDSIAGLEAAELRRRVAAGLARARGYRIYQQDLLTAFVSLMFVIAPNFDEHPTIRAILTQSGRYDDRAQRLAGLPQTCWEEARQSSDSRAWQANG
jgi:hypothetical protein